jgi:hypothetical protein
MVYKVMGNTVVASIDMAYIVAAYIVTPYITPYMVTPYIAAAAAARRGGGGGGPAWPRIEQQRTRHTENGPSRDPRPEHPGRPSTRARRRPTPMAKAHRLGIALMRNPRCSLPRRHWRAKVKERS